MSNELGQPLGDPTVHPPLSDKALECLFDIQGLALIQIV